jgi:hypothetical protein
MNRTIRFVLTGLLVAGTASLARAQSAEKIIERHVKAIGGEKAWKQIVTVQLIGTAKTPSGAEEPFLWQTKRPDRFYMEVQGAQGATIDAFNGRSAWHESPAEGLRTLTGRDQARGRATAFYRHDHFLTYKKEKTRVRFAGNETVAGRRARVVELTSREGIQRRLFFDAASYLLLKEQQETERGTEEILYADYRPVDGVKEPFRLSIRRGAEQFEVEVREVRHNARIEDAVFDFPRRAGAPLPDIPTLLREVVKNQKKTDEIQENYTYTKNETELEIDDKGHIKEKKELTYEIFYVGDWSIQKLVAKDGKPLSPQEARKEQERVEKIIKDYEEYKKKEAKEKVKKARVAGRRKGNPAKGEPDEENSEEAGISDFLRVMRLANPRRERFRGQDVIVFEFEPQPNYKARNRAESLIQKLVGTVWIDEQAKQVARLEARLSDNFRIGGGLMASLHRGSAMVFEQERVNNEIWLPRYAEVNLSARVLLVKGFKVNRVVRFSDYQKFKVETFSEIKPPQPPQ